MTKIIKLNLEEKKNNKDYITQNKNKIPFFIFFKFNFTFLKCVFHYIIKSKYTCMQCKIFPIPYYITIQFFSLPYK